MKLGQVKKFSDCISYQARAECVKWAEGSFSWLDERQAKIVNDYNNEFDVWAKETKLKIEYLSPEGCSEHIGDGVTFTAEVMPIHIWGDKLNEQ